MPYDLDHLERLRDHSYRRLPGRAVRDARGAVRFVNEVGLCSVFTNHERLYPCLWVAVCGRRNPVYPEHTHFDPELSLTWRLKDTLPARKRLLYCRLLGNKPTMVALDLMPYLYALFGPRHDEQHHYDYEDGRLSGVARQIVETLLRRHPLPTADLKRRIKLPARNARPIFNRAMAELQRRLYITMVEVRYEPSFTYVWECIEHRFPRQVKAGRQVARRAAIAAIIPRHLGAVHYTREHSLARLLDAAHDEVDAALHELAAACKLERQATIHGLRGGWLVWKTT